MCAAVSRGDVGWEVVISLRLVQYFEVLRTSVHDGAAS
jgi:hypothetical protein